MSENIFDKAVEDIEKGKKKTFTKLIKSSKVNKQIYKINLSFILVGKSNLDRRNLHEVVFKSNEKICCF